MGALCLTGRAAVGSTNSKLQSFQHPHLQKVHYSQEKKRPFFWDPNAGFWAHACTTSRTYQEQTEAPEARLPRTQR